MSVLLDSWHDSFLFWHVNTYPGLLVFVTSCVGFVTISSNHAVVKPNLWKEKKNLVILQFNLILDLFF